MAVYRHNYRAYEGTLTPQWTRLFVLVRYALSEVWSSKITIGIATLSLLPNIIFMILLFLVNNPLARALIGKTTKDTVEVTTPKGGKSYEVVRVAFRA